MVGLEPGHHTNCVGLLPFMMRNFSYHQSLYPQEMNFASVSGLVRRPVREILARKYQYWIHSRSLELLSAAPQTRPRVLVFV